MYRENEFYYITDRLHFDVYNVALKQYIISEERIIIKVFKKNKELVIIEVLNGVNTIVKDTRKDKNSDLCDMDLIFVKVLERYTSDYELKGMCYEYIDGIGSWYRVLIDGFDPNDKDLNIFYNQKLVTEDMITHSDVDKSVKDKQLKFLKITKGLKFSKPAKVKKLLDLIVND